MNTVTLVSTIIRILAIILAAIFFTQVALRITGHSPTEFQLIMGSFGGLALLLIGVMLKMSEFKGRIINFMGSTDRRLNNLENNVKKNTEDIVELKVDMCEVKTDVRYLKNDVREIKSDLKNIKSILKAKL